MTDWSLSKILLAQHENIQQKLSRIRTTIGHPGSKGAASEKVWLELLQNYLPQRYQAESAHVVDSHGKFSDQIDVVIFDRQYSPFIFKYEGQTIIPSESVYAVFEAKQSINLNNLEYTKKKVSSVRSLHRTSLPIPHAGGTYPPKAITPILGGILALESDWQPKLGQPLKDALAYNTDDEKLDFGCVAAHGNFYFNSENKNFDFSLGDKPATEFLFKLISMLQVNGTVPMIDIQAYAQWLNVL